MTADHQVTLPTSLFVGPGDPTVESNLAALTATGVGSSLRRMPAGTILDQLTDTAYGRVLLAKVLLVVAFAVGALVIDHDPHPAHPGAGQDRQPRPEMAAAPAHRLALADRLGEPLPPRPRDRYRNRLNILP